MLKIVKLSVILSIMLPLVGFSQDHFGVFLTDGGVEKVLSELVKNYNRSGDMTSFTVPSGRVDSKILKKDFDRIPIVEKLKDFAVIDMNADIPFYIKWSPMNF